MSSEPPTVLVVDDDPAVADVYADQLDDGYTIRVAYSGSEAIHQLDERVGVVVLDRRMPDPSGEDVLAYIREHQLDSRVAIVTAVEPDFDIIDMEFDDYLVKPISGDDLREAVERLLRVSTYEEQLQEYYSLVSKRAALETHKSQEDLEDSDEYQHFKDYLETKREGLNATLTEFEEEDFDIAFKGFS